MSTTRNFFGPYGGEAEDPRVDGSIPSLATISNLKTHELRVATADRPGSLMVVATPRILQFRGTSVTPPPASPSRANGDDQGCCVPLPTELPNVVFDEESVHV